MLKLALAALLALNAAAAFAADPSFKKVMIVVFENENYGPPLQQPFFSRLAREGALLSNFYAETHPSQPNYIALVAGDTLGVTGDGNVTLDTSHLADQLEAKGLSWKVYAQDYPGGCFLGASHGRYARKHVPFLSFRNVQKNPERCARVVNSDELAKDVAAGTLPDYSLYIPDLDNDGHDTDSGYADRWFERAFSPLLKDRRFMDGMLLAVTFDESEIFSDNHIYTVLYGDSVRPAANSSVKYNHYSLLRMVQDTFGLGSLGRRDARATPIADVWR